MPRLLRNMVLLIIVLGLVAIVRVATAGEHNELVACIQSCIEDPLFCDADCAFPGDGVTGVAQSYTDQGDIVLDDNTKLKWIKKTNDDSEHDRDNTMNYADAQDWVADRNAENYGGHDDWRLPTRLEAMTITTYGSGYPCMNSVFGPATLSVATYYWTSTPSPVNSGLRFIQDYRTCLNTTSSTSNTHRVIAVR